MKFSNETIELLKNFATINQNMLFIPGNRLRTMSVLKNSFGEVTIPENIPTRFAIYALPEFLGILGMFTEPDITFNDNHLIISQGKNSVKYFYSSEAIIISPPEGKEMKLDDGEIKFKLSADDLNQIGKASAIMKLDTIGVSKKGVRVFLDKAKDSTSNVFSLDVEVDSDIDESKEVQLKIASLKMIPGSYDVIITLKGLVKFTNIENPSLVYFFPLDKK